MCGEFNSAVSQLKEWSLTFFTHCTCHTAHLCMSHTCERLPRTAEDLYTIYTITFVIVPSARKSSKLCKVFAMWSLTSCFACARQDDFLGTCAYQELLNSGKLSKSTSKLCPMKTSCYHQTKFHHCSRILYGSCTISWILSSKVPTTKCYVSMFENLCALSGKKNAMVMLSLAKEEYKPLRSTDIHHFLKRVGSHGYFIP